MTKLSTILALTLIVSFAPSAFAQGPTDSTTPIRSEVRQDVRQELRQEVREQLRSNVAGLHAERLKRRFTFYDQRFESIIVRLATRLNLLESQGKDTTELVADLAAAKETWQLAKTKGASAVAAFLAIDPAKFSEQKSQALAARDLAQEARELYQKTHRQLQALIPQLQKLSK